MTMYLTMSDAALIGGVICCSVVVGTLAGAVITAVLLLRARPAYRPPSAHADCVWCGAPLSGNAALTICDPCIRERLTPPPDHTPAQDNGQVADVPF